MGFLRRRDYVSGNGSAGYGWRPGVGSPLNRFGFSLTGSFFRRNEDDSIESGAYGVEGSLETRGGHRLSANVTRSYEDLVRAFALSEGAIVPIGSYWFIEGGLNYTSPAGDWFRPAANLSGGRFYDGAGSPPVSHPAGPSPDIYGSQARLRSTTSSSTIGAKSSRLTWHA